MIRKAEPRDQDDLNRLAIAQWRRTPWATDSPFTFVVATDILVYERAGEVTGCLAFRRGGLVLYVAHVWVADGFAGARAGVALMKRLAAAADAAGMLLMFNVSPENRGLRQAVEEHSCEPHVDAEPGVIFYERKARIMRERWAS